MTPGGTSGGAWLVGGGRSGEAISRPLPVALGSAAARPRWFRQISPPARHTHRTSPGREKKKKNVPAEQVLPLPRAKRLLGEMRMRIRICIRWAWARWGHRGKEGRSLFPDFSSSGILNPEHSTPRGARYSHHPSTLWLECKRRPLAMTSTVY